MPAQFFVKKWHAVFVGVIAVIVVGAHLWHSRSSITLRDVSQLSDSELRAVYYTIESNVFPIEPKHWRSLIHELGGLHPTTNTGRGRTSWGAVMCFELDWGEDRRYWVRLRTREGLGDRIIANLEEPLGDAGSFHHKGNYDGAPLWDWFHHVKPRVNGFPHRIGGPGCLPQRGTAESHLWASFRNAN